MRPINKRRWLVEHEGRIHAVKRGRSGRFHFENMPRLHRILAFFLRVTFTKWIGQVNALKVKLEQFDLACPSLPAAFDGLRILLVADPHIDNTDALVEKIIKAVDSVAYDICILGGDYTFGRAWKNAIDYSNLETIAKYLVSRSPVYGVLGNHDIYDVGELLETIGVIMLVNDNAGIDRDGEKIYISGLDDCHYFGADDIKLTDESIEEGVFKIMVSHSPETYKKAADAGYALYFAGHTHAGQVCLPGQKAIVRGTSVPTRILNGLWHHGKMTGYTSRGVGTSGIPVRFFCPPQIPLITLRSVPQIQ
ncbi:MAG: metallophosphoesterase [Planctomycetes bacterium]|nr:metallophosphoesterase [Planctomycetota bacterium]